MKPKVLVTGAGGFIGRHAVESLIEKGCEVHAVTREKTLSVPGAQWCAADILDRGQARRLIQKVRPSHLLHLAWVTEPGEFWTSDQNQPWLEASEALVKDFWKSGGVKAVVAGSCAEYAWKKDVYSEDSLLEPETSYGKSKNALRERLVEKALKEKKELAWGRLFFIYGPYENPNRLVPSVILSLLHGREALCTAGDQMLDVLHVRDVARAFAELVLSPVTGAFNIASGVPVTVKELVTLIANKLGKESLLRLGALPKKNTAPSLVADTSRLKNQLGWRPLVELSEGLDEMIAWWKDRQTL